MMDLSSLQRCAAKHWPQQGSVFYRRASPSPARSLAKPAQAGRKQWRCRVADQDVATEQEIEAMEDGAVAIPEDPAGQPITGGRPAPGPQRGEPAGSQSSPNVVNPDSSLQLDEIKVGEWYEGTVNGAESYGVFFDIGTGKAGLCHVSQLTTDFVADAREYLQKGEKRHCRVINVDVNKRKIGLSLLDEGVKRSSPQRSDNGDGRPPRNTNGRKLQRSNSRTNVLPNVKPGDKRIGKVTSITDFGAFLQIEEGFKEGLLHVRQMNLGPNVSATDSDYSTGQEVEVYVLDVDTTTSRMALGLSPPEEGPPQQFKEARQQIKDPARARKADKSDRSEPRTQKATATLGSKSSKRKAKSLSGGMSALGSALAMAGFKGRAQLDKEAKSESKATGSADVAEAEPKQEEQPEKLEKSDEVPETSEDVQLDSAAIPSGSLVTDTIDLDSSDTPSASANAGPATEEAAPAEEKPEEAIAASGEDAGATPAEEPAAALEAEKATDEAAAPFIEEPKASAASDEEPALEGGPATSDPGSPVEKTEEHPEESVAAPVEKSEAPSELPPALEGEPTPTEEKKEDDEPVKEISAISAGQEADNEAKAGRPQPSGSQEKVTEIDVEDSASNLQPERAENPINAAVSTPQQEASLASEDIDGGVVTPENLPEAPVPQEASKEEAAPPPAESTPQPTQAGAIEETPQPGSPVETQQEAPSNPIEKAVEAARNAPKQVASEATAATEAPVSAKVVKDLREKTGAGMMDCKKALRETQGDVEAAIKFLRKKGLAGADKKAGRAATEGLVASYIHAGSGLGVLIEVNCETDFVARGDIFKGLCSDLAMQLAAFGDVVAVSGDSIDPALLEKEREIEMGKEDILSKPENKRAMIVEGRISKTKKKMSLMDQPYIKNNEKDVQTFVKETIAQLGENIQVRRFERFVLGEGIEKKSADLAKDVEEQTSKMKEAAAAKAKEEAQAAAEGKKEDLPEPSAEQVANLKVSAKEVSELRKSSGAGMMDCKRALAACDGDLKAASDYLRKKGLASADKKAGRIASEGAVVSYIHGGRLGVLVEVNCETDFVARGDVFQTLAADVAMQLASNEQVEAVSKDDFPQENLAKEREIAMQMEDIQSKPENIRAKIVDGRLGKYAAERSLLEQPYIKDPKKSVGQHVKEIISQLGENITVRRFARYTLGEGLAKKEENFAEEIAKATGGQ